MSANDIRASQIPIVKITVDHMQHAMLMALDETLLAQQLREAARQALTSINFTEMIRAAVTRMAEEMLDDCSYMDPVRDYLHKNISQTVKDLHLEGEDNAD